MGFGARRQRIEQRLDAAGVPDLRVIDAVRAELAKEAVNVVGHATADDGHAKPMGGQRRLRRGGGGFLNVVHGGGAKGIDLVRGPQVRGKLFREDCRRVDPVGLLQFARKLKLRERGHGGGENRGLRQDR